MLPPRPWLAATALACALALAACGSDGKADPEETGRRDRAVTVLRDYGLSKAEAECITDELGAETVAEATDVAILASGQPYKDAARACAP
ncbi:MAG: hypothetical protein R2746_12145 [Acidimicrobiales bacterium]